MEEAKQLPKKPRAVVAPDQHERGEIVEVALDAVAAAGDAISRATNPIRESDALPRRVQRVAAQTGTSADALTRAIVRAAIWHPRLLDLPPTEAIKLILRTVTASADSIESASVWIATSEGRARCIAAVGRKPTRRVREVASAAIMSRSAPLAGSGRSIFGVPLRRLDTTIGALVVRLESPSRELPGPIEDAAAMIPPLIERATLLEQNARRDELLTASAHRRLTRLTLDMHDGPLQDVMALLGDVRLYRRQLMQTISGHENAGILIGRIDDFEARLVAIDDELRKLAQSFESPSLLERPFEEALAGELRLTRNVGITVDCEVRVDADSMTASQRIATLRVVQEALNNVRDHSGASRVAVRIIEESTHVSVSVADDGGGFDVEKTLVSAGRRGRLGLVGMAERIRMLGGTFDIQSQPYQGTTISVSLPRWRPTDG